MGIVWLQQEGLVPVERCLLPLPKLTLDHAQGDEALGPAGAFAHNLQRVGQCEIVPAHPYVLLRTLVDEELIVWRVCDRHCE
jgi:hypothetical protein